jgi:hypothetical protein
MSKEKSMTCAKTYALRSLFDADGSEDLKITIHSGKSRACERHRGRPRNGAARRDTVSKQPGFEEDGEN